MVERFMVESNSLDRLLALKAHIPKNLAAGVIYKFQYEFFGESGIKEHTGKSFNNFSIVTTVKAKYFEIEALTMHHHFYVIAFNEASLVVFLGEYPRVSF